MTERLLDVGCGDCTTALGNLWPFTHHYHGIDIDAEAVAHANDIGLNVVRGDVDTGLPYPDESFAKVVCKAVLEHVKHPLSVVEECYRVLEPDGWLYVVVPSDRSYDVWGDYTHRRAFRKDALLDILVDGGFTHVEISPRHPIDSVGHGLKSLLRILTPWTPYGYPRAYTGRAKKEDA